MSDSSPTPQPPSDLKESASDGASASVEDQPQQLGEPLAPDTYHASPVWKRLYAFMLGPALVAMVALGIFTVVSVMTDDAVTPGELVTDLESGAEHRRWQAAFGLTRYLQPSISTDGAAPVRETNAAYAAKLAQVRPYVPQLLSIYEDVRRGDERVRRFLALAFSYLGDARTLPALMGSLDDGDVELVHYALSAIARTLDGTAGAPAAAAPEGMTAAIVKASRRAEDDVRATAVYVLGIVAGAKDAGAKDAGDADSSPEVQRLLEAVDDPAPSVQWNAAFALARLGHSGGEKVIAELLDRGPIFAFAGEERARQHDLFLNAVRSAGMVRSPSLRERLVRIAAGDSNPKARDAAIKLIAKHKLEE